MSFYGDMSKTTNELLSEFGQTVTITYKTSGAYDPAALTSSVSTTTATAKAALFGYMDKDIDGTLIRRGDRNMIMSAISISLPNVEDTITDAAGKIYTILSISPVSPAGAIVAVKAHIRGQ